MTAYIKLLKSNIMLLLRNKGYLFLIIVLPLVSVLLLNIRMTGGTDNYYQVYELEDDTGFISDFVASSKMEIKVYDSADNDASKYFLNMLSNSGMYRIYHYPSTNMNAKEIKKSATSTANQSSIQALIYLSEDFLTSSTLTIYPVGEDSRLPLLKQHLSQNIRIMKMYMEEEGNVNLTALKEQIFVKEVVELDVSESKLTIEEQRCQANTAFSLASMVLCFVFTGVCITSVINYEKDHQVLTRILMIPGSGQKYVLVKVSITLLTVVIQSLITMIYFMTFVKMDLGISVFEYIGLIFGLGIIFNLLSVVIGMFITNTLTTSYITFFIWAITNMLAGIYFPGIAVPDFWEKAALFTPQKWLLITSESLIKNDYSTVLTYIIVMISFIVFITTIGFFGIKVNEKE